VPEQKLLKRNKADNSFVLLALAGKRLPPAVQADYRYNTRLLPEGE
jgi:hypothetical protein